MSSRYNNTLRAKVSAIVLTELSRSTNFTRSATRLNFTPRYNPVEGKLGLEDGGVGFVSVTVAGSGSVVEDSCSAAHGVRG